MQTALPPEFAATADGREADTILRACVHCGFCNATCPTYQLFGDELDGPRGRIYQIKGWLEGGRSAATLRLHLDRCLSCRACETTCPSGVRYHRLLDIARERLEAEERRPLAEQIERSMLNRVLPDPQLFERLVRGGRALSPLLPKRLLRGLPQPSMPPDWPPPRHTRRYLLFQGCVQPTLAPAIDRVAARVLDRLGVSLVPLPASCCGAVNHHLGDGEQARARARANIDRILQRLDDHAGVVVTASACALTLKEYPDLLRDDPLYRPRAQALAAATRDLIELVEEADPTPLEGQIDNDRRIAFHAPCTLQHGERLGGRVEALLRRLGFQLAEVRDAHLCCGSAGTYSVLQPAAADRLRRNKISALRADAPDCVATANIGCLHHLRDPALPQVVHWIELLDRDA